MVQQEQSNVVGSTMKVECTAVSFVVREALWICKAYEDYAMKLDAPIVINEDNQGCIAIAKDPSHHGRAKHFDVHVHFVWHQIKSKEISLQYCPTMLMAANILTKPLLNPSL